MPTPDGGGSLARHRVEAPAGLQRRRQELMERKVTISLPPEAHLNLGLLETLAGSQGDVAHPMSESALISGDNGRTRVLGTVEITTLWCCPPMMGERYSIIFDEDFFPSTYIKLRS